MSAIGFFRVFATFDVVGNSQFPGKSLRPEQVEGDSWRILFVVSCAFLYDKLPTIAIVDIIQIGEIIFEAEC